MRWLNAAEWEIRAEMEKRLEAVLQTQARDGGMTLIRRLRQFVMIVQWVVTHRRYMKPALRRTIPLRETWRSCSVYIREGGHGPL